MPNFQPQVYRINDIVGWHDRRELRLAPEFQRRPVWTPRAKSFLIDSILRGMPLPQFFIREVILPREKRTVREVVDGQQRLTAILGYVAGEFTVLPMHNADAGRLKFDQLPEVTQKNFLSYPLSVNVLEGSGDADVLEIFSRINSYSEPLNSQEKLNALYVGAFKRSAGKLALDHLNFWRRNNVLSERAIARMKDVELTSELVGVMLYGLETGKKRVAQMFKEFDDGFPQFAFLQPRFADTLELSANFVGGDLSATIFSRSSLLYSLFAVIYSMRYGFGSGADVRARDMNGDRIPTVQDALIRLSQAVETDDRPPEYAEFYLASRQSTDKLPQRTTRHNLLRQLVAPAFEG